MEVCFNKMLFWKYLTFQIQSRSSDFSSLTGELKVPLWTKQTSNALRFLALLLVSCHHQCWVKSTEPH